MGSMGRDVVEAPTLADLLAMRADAHPERCVYRFLQDGETEAGQLSYAELDRKARAVAVWLGGRCRRGDRVLLFCPSSLEFMIGFFGCLYAGNVAVPVHTPDPARVRRTVSRLRLIVRDATPSAVLTNQATLDRIDLEACEEWAIPLTNWRAVESISDDLARDWQRPPIDPSTLAFLQYTSGSTGEPKGVMVQHGNILANEEMIRVGLGLDADSHFVSWLPLYHDMGIIGPMLQAVYTGASAILMPPMAFLQKPYRWLKAISDFGAYVAGGPNFAYDLCARRITDEQKTSLDLSTWRVAFTGAEPIRRDTVDRFAEAFQSCGFDHRSIYPCYGMAEATLFVTGIQRDTGVSSYLASRDELESHRVRAASDEERSCAVVNCGFPRVGLDVRVIHPETRRPVSAGEVGEIWVSGPSVAAGYWQRPDATAQSFHGLVEGEGERRYLRTGDLGFSHDGGLYVTGRTKEILIVRGHNYYPQDIEQTVERSHPGLQPDASAAFAVEIEGEERLVIVAEARREGLRRLRLDDVVRDLRANLSTDYGLSLSALVVLRPGHILRTTSGKLQRRLMREQFLAGALEGVAMAWSEADAPKSSAEHDASSATEPAQPVPNTPGQRSVAEIRDWLMDAVARALHSSRSRIDPSELLAHSGLDSLKVVSLTGELSEWLKQPVAPSVVYDHPSIDALARHFAGSAPSFVDAPRVEGVAMPIAVIGMSCRFPGADSVDEFWRLLTEGRDAVVQVPSDRWDNERFYDAKLGRPGTTNSRWGGFISDIDRFDPLFFGVSPLEASSMDPQQRLVMMTAWEALENAAIAPSSLSGSSAGVVIGMSTGDYGQIVLRETSAVDGFSVTGLSSSIAANRLSFFLDIHGPSLTVDAACASSLAAVQLACQYLRAGDSDLMLAGAVNAMVAKESMISLAQAGLLSPDGRCRTFDEGANGYVRGEGCGVLVLKRLADAVRDGDPVLGVIRDVSMTHNGLSNGLKAPSGRAQRQAILRSLSGAGLAPNDLGYLEAHGTGTLMGDAIELQVIRSLFSPREPADGVCHLGSVKTNIGHLEPASGMAGLIKVLLMLEHGQIPAHLHLNQPNSSVPLDTASIRIARASTEWPRAAGPRRAGVSSFGFGGVNCFAVLEEAPARAPHSAESPHKARQELLVLSAKSKPALDALAARYVQLLSAESGLRLADICHTSRVGRAHFRHRLAVVAGTPGTMVKELQAALHGEPGASATRHEAALDAPKIAFLFSGQGAQYEQMGRALYEAEPVFRAALERCAEILTPLLDVPLLDILYPNERAGLIHQTRYTQPALFAFEYALYCLWRSWGIEPAAVAGHSIGEYVAACVAGVFGLEDGLRLVARRAALMQALPEAGAMLAVFASEQVVREMLEQLGSGIEIACVNGPRNTVISGAAGAIEQAAALAKSRQIRTETLRVSHAFHSQLMEPMLAPFGELASALTYGRPTLPMASNVTGALFDGTPLSPDYFVRQARQPVRFSDGLAAIERAGITHFLEIGPSTTLLALAQGTLGGDGFAFLPSLREGRDERGQMLETAGALYARGVPVAFQHFEALEKPRRVRLPTYAFQNERYWWESAAPDQPEHAGTPLLESISRGDVAWLSAALTATPAARQLDAQHLHQLAESLIELNARQRDQRSLHDWVFTQTLRPSPRTAARLPLASDGAPRGSYLIIADRARIGTRLADQFGAQGRVARSIRLPSNGSVEAGEAIESALRSAIAEMTEQNSAGVAGVVFLSALDLGAEPTTDAPSLVEDQLDLLLRLQHAVRALLALPAPPPLWLVGHAAHCARGPAQAPLWGFAKTLAAEHPALFAGSIALTSDGSPVLEACVEVIIAPETERWLVLGESGRSVPRLTRPARGSLRPARSFDGIFVVSGGFGDLGMHVGRWLARRGARQLIVISRRGPVTEAAQHFVADLEASGVQVSALCGDIADPAVIPRIQASLASSAWPLCGVFHCAGLVQDGLLARQTAEQFRSVLSPKVGGAWNLWRAVEHEKPAWFVMFGSVASVFGSPGQANYAAANAYLDAFALHLNELGCPAQCLSFGPWKDCGMVGRLDSSLQARLTALGLRMIDPELGIQCLEQALELDEAHLVLAPIDWNVASLGFSAGHLALFVEELARGAAKPRPAPSSQAPHPPSLALDLRALTARERRGRLTQYLQQSIANVLKYPEGALPDPGQGFFSMGLDSLMLVTLLRRLEAELGVPLSPSVGFENPTIGEMVRHLDGLLSPLPTSELERAPVAALETAAPTASNGLGELSEEEALSLLDEKIALLAKGEAL